MPNKRNSRGSMATPDSAPPRRAPTAFTVARKPASLTPRSTSGDPIRAASRAHSRHPGAGTARLMNTSTSAVFGRCAASLPATRSAGSGAGGGVGFGTLRGPFGAPERAVHHRARPVPRDRPGPSEPAWRRTSSTTARARSSAERSPARAGRQHAVSTSAQASGTAIAGRRRRVVNRVLEEIFMSFVNGFTGSQQAAVALAPQQVAKVLARDRQLAQALPQHRRAPRGVCSR